MKERVFASNFRAELKSWGGDEIHVQALIDAPRAQAKPYDGYCLYDDRFYAFEFKVVKGLSINADLLRPHQFDGLMEVDNCEGCAYIIIRLEHPKMKQYCFVATVPQWLGMFDYSYVDDAYVVGIKSRKLVELLATWKQCFMERIKIGGTSMWDFRPYWVEDHELE